MNATASMRTTIFRIIAARKFTPHRGHTADSAPTISLQAGHLRRTIADPRGVEVYPFVEGFYRAPAGTYVADGAGAAIDGSSREVTIPTQTYAKRRIHSPASD